MTTRALPGGTVTFLFTDIEGSTSLWEKHGEAMRPALAAHDALLRSAVMAHNGLVVKTTGDGVHAVFPSAADGLLAAVLAQRQLLALSCPTIAPDRIEVRMGLHTGEAELRDGDYYGSHVNRAARIMALGHGGQVLVSGTLASLVSDLVAAGELQLQDLGRHKLRGLTEPEQIWQLMAPDLKSAFPPLRSAPTVIGNLPARVSSFIGRTREMALVREKLREGRLLTLVGPGGTGKTRLALQVATDVQPGYAHGAWWINLAGVTDPSLVPNTVAQTLGLSDGAGMPVEMMITDYLREKHILLILDNCEHLIDRSARLAADLISTCPRLSILASSREALNVYGEATIHLATLTLPPENAIQLAAVRLSEAVQLFVERASAVRPDFVLNEQNAAAVSQIARRLDGIPLAIELAAARMTVFSVDQVAARLDDRFRLLTGGSRTALPRQQTLRALIDWSYDLLDKDEKQLLLWLSVFAGGWTFEAAEAMAVDLDAYALLPALVNKSLVVMADPSVDAWGETDAVKEPRFRLLETIRQYALDRLLEQGGMETVRDRHFDYFYNYAAPLQYGSVPGETLLTDGRLLDELDNFSEAVDWGLRRYPERVIDLYWQLAPFLADQNPGVEGYKWVRAALDELAQLPPGDAATTARRREAYLKGTVTSALLLLFLGDLHEAQRLAREVLGPLRSGEGDQILLAVALYTVGQASYLLGEPSAADEVRAAIEVLQPLKLAPFLEVSYMILAGAEIAHGNEAASLEALDHAKQILDHDTGVYFPWTEFVRIGMHLAQGSDLPTMQAAVDESLARLHRHRSYRVAAMIESDFAHGLRAAGHLDEAAEIYRRTIRNWQQLGHRAAVANQLECLAYIYRVWDQPERAALLLGAAERLREESGQPMLGAERQVYEVEVDALRTALPPETFNRLWSEGRALSTEAAVQLAVEDSAANAA